MSSPTIASYVCRLTWIFREYQLWNSYLLGNLLACLWCYCRYENGLKYQFDHLDDQKYHHRTKSMISVQATRFTKCISGSKITTNWTKNLFWNSCAARESDMIRNKYIYRCSYSIHCLYSDFFSHPNKKSINFTFFSKSNVKLRPPAYRDTLSLAIMWMSARGIERMSEWGAGERASGRLSEWSSEWVDWLVAGRSVCDRVSQLLK